MSIDVSVALDRSAQSELLLELVNSWTTTAWYLAAVLVAAAFAGIGVDILSSGALPAWSGWICLGSAALSVVLLVVTRDAAPVIVYLPVTPLAIAVSIAAARNRRTNAAAASW